MKLPTPRRVVHIRDPEVWAEVWIEDETGTQWEVAWCVSRVTEILGDGAVISTHNFPGAKPMHLVRRKDKLVQRECIPDCFVPGHVCGVYASRLEQAKIKATLPRTLWVRHGKRT